MLVSRRSLHPGRGQGCHFCWWPSVPSDCYGGWRPSGPEAEVGVGLTYMLFASLRVVRPSPCRRRSSRPPWMPPTVPPSSIREVRVPSSVSGNTKEGRKVASCNRGSEIGACYPSRLPSLLTRTHQHASLAVGLLLPVAPFG